MKPELTKKELEKIKEEWKSIRKSESEVDYNQFINPRIHRRYRAIKRADDVAYRKRNVMKNKILTMFKDELTAKATEYAKQVKVIDNNGSLEFIEPKE